MGREGAAPAGPSSRCSIIFLHAVCLPQTWSADSGENQYRPRAGRLPRYSYKCTLVTAGMRPQSTLTRLPTLCVCGLQGSRFSCHDSPAVTCAPYSACAMGLARSIGLDPAQVSPAPPDFCLLTDAFSPTQTPILPTSSSNAKRTDRSTGLDIRASHPASPAADDALSASRTEV